MTVGIVLAILFAGLSFARWPAGDARDFYQFWGVGRAAKLYGSPNVYTESERMRLESFLSSEAARSGSPVFQRGARYWHELEPAGTPFLYTVFHLLSTDNFDRDYRFFMILSTICFGVGLFSVGLAAGLSPLWSAALVLLPVFFFGPLVRDIELANVNRLQIGYLALVILLPRRRESSLLALVDGALLALGFYFKPTIAPVILFIESLILVDRHWRYFLFQSIGAILGTLAVFALTEVTFGDSISWRSWFALAPAMLLRYENTSMLGLLFGNIDLRFFNALSLLLISGILTLIVTTRARSLRNGNGPQLLDFRQLWMATGLGLGVLIATSPLVHYHYLLLMLPIAVYFLTSSSRFLTNSAPQMGTQALISVIAVVLMSFEQSVTAYIGSLLLTGLCFGELFRLRTGRSVRVPSAR